MGVAKTFRELRVWTDGIQLVKGVYHLTNDFPPSELYGLISQMRRAAVSIPANIAEGFRRKGGKEFKQFLNISHGSLAELETHLIVAAELGYVKEGDHSQRILNQIDGLSRMITALIKSLERRSANAAHGTQHSAQMQGEA